MQFYITPEEQRTWLIRVLSDPRAWCALYRFFQGDPVWPVTFDMLRELSFKEQRKNTMSLYLGHRELAPRPVWRVTEGGLKEIDFLRSQVVQLDPSVVVENLLLEGQMGISQRFYYEESGISPEPIRKWHQRLVRSLRGLRAPGAKLMYQPADGPAEEIRGDVVTPGAVEWYRAGGELKFNVKGPQSFHVWVDGKPLPRSGTPGN